jgi:hypothetical protein
MLSAEPHWKNREASIDRSYSRSLDNFYRTYDPSTGRYLEADPIGQLGLLAFNEDLAATYLNRFAPLRRGGSLLGPAGVLDTHLYAYAINSPTNMIDPSGLISSTFEIYAGVGVRFTFGLDKSGDAFFEIGLGFGGGISLTVDPDGQPIAAECDKGDDLTVALSALAEAGLGAGPIAPGVSASAHASGVLNTPACGCVGADVSPNVSTDFKKSRYGLSGSLTGNAVFFRGNKLPGRR